MTTVHVCGEYRLFRAPDGQVYAESVFGYGFWQRYLRVFDQVVVVARVDSVDDSGSLLPVEGPRVSVDALPYYQGLGAYVRRWLALRRAIKRVTGDGGAFILRVPGPIGTLTWRALRRRGRPYAAEVVGDPGDVFAPGVVDHPLRRLLRWRASRDLRGLCRSAVGVGYVSSVRLPERYPTGGQAFVYSSASMPDDAYRGAARRFEQGLTRLISVGSMEQAYKGFDVLLEAFALILDRVPEAQLTIVGGGARLTEYVAQAERLRIADRVEFTGKVATAVEVRELLDAAELYVSASRTEGLPRSVIEAMARGLPCVATDVGSTSELVRADLMCPSGDPQALAEVCLRSMQDVDLANAQAETNLERSRRYHASRLQAERDRLYRHLAEADSR